MTTKFPVALDSFPTINGTDLLTSPQHSAQHNNVADAVSALEAKVGVNGSTVATSLTYQVSQKAGINHTHTGVYAASSHGHTIADVTGVQAGLDARYTKAEVDALLAASGGRPMVHEFLIGSVGSTTAVPAGSFLAYGPFTLTGLTAADGICVNFKVKAAGIYVPLIASGLCTANDQVKIQIFNLSSIPLDPSGFTVIVTVFKK
jgi:hypothetical protein